MQTGKGILIPSILKVGNGTLKKIGQYLKAENLEQVVIFFGNGLIDLFGMDVMDSLKQEGITVLEYSELDTVDIDDIITLAFAMPNTGRDLNRRGKSDRCRKIRSFFAQYSIYQCSHFKFQ